MRPSVLEPGVSDISPHKEFNSLWREGSPKESDSFEGDDDQSPDTFLLPLSVGLSSLVDLVAGKVKITEWAQNPDRSPFFSNIATIKFNYGDETAKRLELSYALELSILRKTAFGATLKIGTMMTRIAKEFLADQIRSTFDNVHASFVAEQRALTRADLALNGEMPGHEHIVATQDLEDRVNHLLAWNRLPDDDKFTVESVKHRAARYLLL